MYWLLYEVWITHAIIYEITPTYTRYNNFYYSILYYVALRYTIPYNIEKEGVMKVIWLVVADIYGEKEPFEFDTRKDRDQFLTVLNSNDIDYIFATEPIELVG